jgi:hypothetical protein
LKYKIVYNIYHTVIIFGENIKVSGKREKKGVASKKRKKRKEKKGEY